MGSDCMGDRGVNWRIILKWILEKESVYWIKVAEDRI
jgi:hypothetical protein